MKNDATSPEDDRTRARHMAEVILKVRGGRMNASEAARALGISRKTYYKWERRGLAAMLEGLCERNSGRPASPVDGAKADRKTMKEMERTLQRQDQRREIRVLLRTEGKKKN